MAPYTHNPNPNAFVRTMRKASNPIGFQKGYNFILWFIFAGAVSLLSSHHRPPSV